MCDHASLLYTFEALLLYETTEGVEGPAGFEGADALLVFAFEEKSDLRLRCTLTAFAYRLAFIPLALGLRCDVINSFACFNWSAMDVGLNAFVGCLDGFASQWWARFEIGHSANCWMALSEM